MKKLLIALLVAVYVTNTPSALAEVPPMVMLTDRQLELVRTNCANTKATLERVRANDALMRINLGREYGAISTKLMAPMNSRIALNKLNGIDLTKTTVDFDRQINTFRTAYQKYEQVMSRTVQTDCQEKPADFYITIGQARYYRAEVRKSIEELERLALQYRSQLDKLDLKSVSTNKSGGNNG